MAKWRSWRRRTEWSPRSRPRRGALFRGPGDAQRARGVVPPRCVEPRMGRRSSGCFGRDARSGAVGSSTRRRRALSALRAWAASVDPAPVVAARGTIAGLVARARGPEPCAGNAGHEHNGPERKRTLPPARSEARRPTVGVPHRPDERHPAPLHVESGRSDPLNQVTQVGGVVVQHDSHCAPGNPEVEACDALQTDVLPQRHKPEGQRQCRGDRQRPCEGSPSHRSVLDPHRGSSREKGQRGEYASPRDAGPLWSYRRLFGMVSITSFGATRTTAVQLPGGVGAGTPGSRRAVGPGPPPLLSPLPSLAAA